MSPDCPNCGAWITKVILTKFDSEVTSVVRRRHCQYCDHRFYTRQAHEEIVDVKWVQGTKKQTIPEIVKVYATPFKGRKST
jgi:transcriptional regulator NrdR family protein